MFRAFSERFIKVLSWRTIFIVPTSMCGQIQDISGVFAVYRTVLFTCSGSNIKQRLISGTWEARIILWAYPWKVVRARLELHIADRLFLENLCLILALSGVTPMPIAHIQIIFVFILNNFAAFWIYCHFHYWLIVLHHLDLILQFL